MERNTVKNRSSDKIKEETEKSEYRDLLLLLETLEKIDRQERRKPTYTSYFVNIAVNSE
jgi:hypothetical protein